jgi:hypothetical protein
MSNLLNDDVIHEILKYIPYTISRLVNVKFKNIADNIEALNRSNIPIKYSKKHIIAYIKTLPKNISYVSRAIFNYRQCLDHYTTREGISVNVSGIIKEVHELYSKDLIMGPQFLKFMMSKHPLSNNITYVKNKLISTIKYIFDKKSATRYIICFRYDMNLQKFYKSANVVDYEKTKEVILDTLINNYLYPFTDIQLDDNDNKLYSSSNFDENNSYYRSYCYDTLTFI